MNKKEQLLVQLMEFWDYRRRSKYALKRYLVRDGQDHPVAIICPGGGYHRIDNYAEGYPFAKKLNRMGYHAFVLYYRFSETGCFPAPQDDLARAVRTIFKHKKRWHLDLNCYSLWGASAGGHLAASFATESLGYQKYGLPRPGALILAYPVVTMGQFTHTGSRNHLLGENASTESCSAASIEKLVQPDFPPTFLWWGENDLIVNPENSRLLLNALDRAQIPYKAVSYPDVGHGVGIGEGLPCQGWFENAVEFWSACRNKSRM